MQALDHAILSVFVFEVLAKMAVYRLRFPRDPWNIFDFCIVVIVSTMQGQRDAEKAGDGGSADSARTEAELRRLQNEIGELKALLLNERKV